LLLFDPRAGEFQRVRVSGQVIDSRAAEYFMMQGNRGLRFVLQMPGKVEAGDLAEVVGFPDLTGVSPRLSGCIVRRTGHRELPPPRSVGSAELFRPDNDATRVRIQGVLVGTRTEAGEDVLELQNGVRNFLARLASGGRGALKPVSIGSRLELTGVYAAEAGRRLGDHEVGSFELLMSSPAAMTILARPPWWTLRRLLVIVGALGCILVLAALWLTQLHRKVELRTKELEVQIQARQRVEHQRALEQERTRVAQDLHDELGAGLTEITMLAARASSGSALFEKRLSYFEQAGSKARELVETLDEIVWAMNPRHDSVGSLVSYFCLYAERFLGLAGITWHLTEPVNPPNRILDGHPRHQLFLAFKEALNNVVRHSRATEVGLAFGFEGEKLHLAVMDNGIGIHETIPPAASMEGIASMRHRITQLDGRFEVESSPSVGTKIHFFIPLQGSL
ncbi:MAG TPA: ATP-binding protein, partial [Verrucomicrobiae bacterium]|nr:ATP-binding protein [Verrucomicrobiae bacterium]